MEMAHFLATMRKVTLPALWEMTTDIGPQAGRQQGIVGPVANWRVGLH